VINQINAGVLIVRRVQQIICAQTHLTFSGEIVAIAPKYWPRISLFLLTGEALK
jgi:hypothetical protein